MNRKINILIFLILAANTLFAQKQKIWNQPYGDQKLLHFGISIGMNFQDVILKNSGKVSDTGETWYATLPEYSPGLSVGLLGDLYLNPYMNLRFTPMLHFGDKQFEFVTESGEHFKTTIRSNYMSLPLDLKIRAMRLNNYRPYVITGIYSAVELGRKKDEAVLFKPLDYGLTIGLGCDFYLPIIKVVPELRFSFGLADVVEHKRTDLTDNRLQKYSDAISRGLTRMISLTFNFE